MKKSRGGKSGSSEWLAILPVQAGSVKLFRDEPEVETQLERRKVAREAVSSALRAWEVLPAAPRACDSAHSTTGPRPELLKRLSL